MTRKSRSTGPPADEVGYGADVGPDDKATLAAAAELTTEDSLARITSNARATVSTVAIVGALITALGVVSVQTVVGAGTSRWLAISAVAASIASLLAALLFLALRIEPVNTNNLVEVRAWYGRRFRSAWLAAAASWIVLLAVVLAASAAIVGFASDPSNAPALTLRVAQSGSKRVVDADVSLSGLEAGTAVLVKVVGFGACPSVVLMTSKSRADRSGTVAVKSTISDVPNCTSFRLEVSGDGVPTRSITLP